MLGGNIAALIGNNHGIASNGSAAVGIGAAAVGIGAAGVGATVCATLGRPGTALSVPRRHYVGYGFGSAGTGVCGVTKSGDQDPLNCTREELADFEYYAKKYMYFIGCSDGRGLLGVTKSDCLQKFSECLELAKASRAELVFYYTGHGEKGTGNWCFPNNKRITFAEILQLVQSAGVNTWLVCDCCFSGQWAQRELEYDSSLVHVIAACGEDVTASGYALSKPLWRGQNYDGVFGQAPCRVKCTGAMKEGVIPMTKEDFIRCWFVDSSQHGHNWKAGDAVWRP